MDLTKIATPRAIAAYFTEVYSNQIPNLGTRFFPQSKKAGLDLSWILGHKGLPISLMPSTFDAKATLRERIGVARVETEMPFFREGYVIKEKDRQEILRAMDSNDPYVAEVISRIYDDVSDLIAGADVVAERMRWMLLAPTTGTPSINIVANNVSYKYNYDPDGKWTDTHYFDYSSEPWSSTTSNPLTHLQDVKKAMQSNYGVIPTIATMSPNTFNALLENEQIRDAILAQNLTPNVFLGDTEVLTVFRTRLNIALVVYEKMYKDESKVSHSYIPDGIVTLMPDIQVGRTWYGTTPEEADLMSSPNAEVSIVNTGVAVSRFIEPHPVNVQILASEIVLPSYEGMESVAVLNVGYGTF